jgi:Transposase IS116/IS110/IS902 family
VTARGYRRFRCRDCGRQFNERSGGVLNRTCLPSDIVAFVVFCRLRYRLTLRDLSEILLLRGIEVSHETIRDWRPDDIAAIEAATARRDRLDAHIEAALADWSLAPVVHALQALRGMALVAAATLVAELGDITRFANPRQLMAYLGLVPSEHSSGDTRRQASQTLPLLFPSELNRGCHDALREDGCCTDQRLVPWGLLGQDGNPCMTPNPVMPFKANAARRHHIPKQKRSNECGSTRTTSSSDSVRRSARPTTIRSVRHTPERPQVVADRGATAVPIPG